MLAEHSKFLQKERHRPARGLELFPYGDATHGRMTGNRNKPEQRVVLILRSPLYDEHAADAAKDEQRGVVYHIESGDNIEPVIYVPIIFRKFCLSSRRTGTMSGSETSSSAVTMPRLAKWLSARVSIPILSVCSSRTKSYFSTSTGSRRKPMSTRPYLYARARDRPSP